MEAKKKTAVIAEAMEGAADAVAQQGAAIADAAVQVGSDAVDAVTKAGSDAADAVNKAAKNAHDATVKAASSVKAGASDFANATKGAVANAANRMTKAAVKMATQPVDSPDTNKEMTEEQAKREIETRIPEATALLENEFQLEAYLCQMEGKLKAIPVAGDKLSNIPVLISLVRQWIKKEYTVPPAGTIAAIVAALLYFLAPVDVIPDAIPGIGLVDDAMVITVCLKLVESDVDAYRVWREGHFNMLTPGQTQK